MLNNIMKWTALLLLSGVFELARLASGLYLIDVIKKFCGKKRGRGGGRVRDCRLELEVKNGEMITKTENTRMIELVQMCGAFEQIVGLAALEGGISLEEVKSNMLDIHLAAMDMLTEQVIKEKEGKEKQDG